MSENGQDPADKIADAAGKVLESVRHAIEEGIEAIRPTWEEKVAPAVASGAQKVAEWGESARDSADRKAAELGAEDRPSSKILGGALGVGAAAAALGTGAARAIGKAAAEAAADPADSTAGSTPCPLSDDAAGRGGAEPQALPAAPSSDTPSDTHPQSPEQGGAE